MKTTFVLNSEQFGGNEDKKLGNQLMGSFLRKLWMLEKKPDVMIFYNSAVHLLAEGSPVLGALDALLKAGVDLIACGTCVDYYHITDKIRVGRVSSMEEIASILMTSTKVVTP